MAETRTSSAPAVAAIRVTSFTATPRTSSATSSTSPEWIPAIRSAAPAEIEAYDPNNVGGDIAGGRTDLAQLFTRPAWRLDPYSTPDQSIFLCSAATPPGGGVHGMCGYHAARSALRRL